MSCPAKWFLVSELASAYVTHTHRTPKEGIPMANPLHLALLSEGTETWNSWVHTHPPVVADVSEAHLDHLNFDHAHLTGMINAGIALEENL
jgi:hypothetical protein